MPYIVTTKRMGLVHGSDGQEGPFEATLSRRAVATLDEVRTVVQGGWTRHQVEQAISESGGTVGPLPDGTVIEVAHVQPGFLAHTLSMRTDTSEREVIDAFNAAQKAAA